MGRVDEGAAGEIFASLQFLNDGQQTLSWSLESDDGLVVGEASAISRTVRPQQSISVAIVASRKPPRTVFNCRSPLTWTRG
ncbi:MAG: hypothetical protein CM15mP78_07920 [Candidatus Poseidoniales archaeon]|nr:MAG: hypothetical protein CM15mP78_07920 [Candidatus Poseidoniales archaeon]